MRNRLSVVLFSAFLLGMFVSVSYAADNLHPKTTFKLDRAPKYMIPYEAPTGLKIMDKGGTALGMMDPPPTNSPGSQSGLTTYDYQHNGTMGRQIAVNQDNGIVFFVWMAQDNYTIPGDRGVKVQAFDGDYMLDLGGYKATAPDYCGYATCDFNPDGAVDFTAHVDFGSGDYNSTHYYDGLPNNFIFYNDAMWPDESAPWYQRETIWPIMTVHDGSDAGVTEDVIYCLTHVFEGSEDMILYKKVGAAAWDQGMYIETVTDLAYDICADPTSDKVAIVYTDDRVGQGEGDGGQNDLDVYYMLSTDQGANWGDPVCVSNYTEDSLWRAYSDLASLWATDGELHIVAAVRELKDANTFENYKSRLVHWATPLLKASIIDEARYVVSLAPNRPCDASVWNLYIAKPSISECEGKLYALFTKFGDDNEPQALFDCSQSGFINGELYLGGSDDMGATWDTVWNITKTRSPLCDSSLCESDHWSSMARFGMVYGDGTVRDTLDIMYINDKDAGGIPQGEGSWTVNNVMHYRFGCRDISHIPKISLEPREILDPVHTAPGVELPVALKISNIGNSALTIQGISIRYLDGTNWITVGSYTSPVPTSSFITVPVTLNALGVLTTPDPSGWDAEIIVDSDAPTDKDTIRIHLTVASDFNMPEQDTIQATTKQLVIYNTGRLGGDNDGYSWDIPGDCDADLTTPNGDMYLFDASPMMVWNDGSGNLAYTTIFTQIFTEAGTFRPQSPLVVTAGPDYTMARCTLSTTDSLYGVDVTLWAPNDGGDFLIGQYDFHPWNPVKGANEVYVGLISDWDVPSDETVVNGSGNNGAGMVWQRGAEISNTDENAPHSCPITENNRYGGWYLLNAPMYGAWTAENAPMQQGSGMNMDSLYNRATVTGYHMYPGTPPPDTVIDLHTGMTFAKVDMTAKKTYSYVWAMATTNTGELDLKAQLTAAKAWAEAHEIIQTVCECKPGDANNDGQVNVGDAVYLINFVFKGGPAPKPYAKCSGDANKDCQANVGDAVYVINFVFKGGPAPKPCEDWVTACGQY
jgi:hypothetical protein